MTDLSRLIIPRGFRFGAIKAGVKASGRTDFSLIVADSPASAAAAFTANRVIAAPLIVDKQHLHRSQRQGARRRHHAGNANCAQARPASMLPTPLATPRLASSPAARKEVFPSSTGVYRRPTACPKNLSTSCPPSPHLSAQSPTHFLQVAHAILTTDTLRKRLRPHRSCGPTGTAQEIRIAALGKGSGMIHPQLVPHATMLIYILTDAAIEPAVLDSYLRPAIRNQLQPHLRRWRHITNDTVLLLASGAGGVSIGLTMPPSPPHSLQVCTSMARQVVADGEGLTHLVELRIEGAASDADALRVAKAIAHSPLVKTGLGRQRSKLGPSRRRHRLLRRAGRSQPLRHLRSARSPSAATAAAPRSSTRPLPRLCQPERIRHLHPSPPGLRLLRLLDNRPHARVHPHQRRLLPHKIAVWPGSATQHRPGNHPWRQPCFIALKPAIAVSGFAIPKGIHPSRPDPKEGRPGIEDRQGTPILKPL